MVPDSKTLNSYTPFESLIFHFTQQFRRHSVISFSLVCASNASFTFSCASLSFSSFSFLFFSSASKRFLSFSNLSFPLSPVFFPLFFSFVPSRSFFFLPQLSSATPLLVFSFFFCLLLFQCFSLGLQLFFLLL